MRGILILLLLTPCFSISQEFELAQFYNSGKAHNNFTISSTDKIDSVYRVYLKENNIVEDGDLAYKEFVYRHNFFLEKLNKSGRVFSGDEISVYLNEIKDNILRDHEAKGKIHVFLTDFGQLNAFTNDFGNVYVNVGTVAKLNYESELYLLIAHEIAHVLSRHSFKFENVDNHLSKGKFDGVNEMTELDYHKFSQKQELEADSIALGLLKNINYNTNNMATLFDRLRYANDPIFDIEIDFRDIWDKNEILKVYASKLSDSLESYDIELKVKDEDKITTHPSVEQRLDLYHRITANSGNENSSGQNGKFEYLKELAAYVMIKTLMMRHEYIECLYLTCQLESRHPNDSYLQKSKLKLLLLITQSKYAIQRPSIINNYGSSCSDMAYIRFRKCMTLIPALEMNILTLEEIKHAIEIDSNGYYARLKDLSYQFLYKYNPGIITNLNGTVSLNKDVEYRKVSYAFDPVILMTEDQQKILNDLEEEGFIFGTDYFVDSALVLSFLGSFNETDELNNAILSYRARRDRYESMLTLDKFSIEMNPKEAYENYRHGVFESYRPISDSARIALIQSDTYVFTEESDEPVIDYEETLEYEARIGQILQDEELFDISFAYSDRKKSTFTITDNHLHNLLSTWIGECLNFSDLVYSVSDEELLELRSKDGLDYIVYNLNIIEKDPNSKHKCHTLFYNIYLDVHTMGVAYVSKISGSRPPSDNYLRHYFYQSYLGKKAL